MIEPMELTVISIKQRIAEMQRLIKSKSGNVVSDQQTEAPKTTSAVRQASIQRVLANDALENRYASDTYSLAEMLKARIAKVRKDLPLQR